MWLLRNWENITGSRYQLWENLLNRVWVTGLFNLQPASGAVSVGHARQGCQSQEQGHLESYFQHKSTLYLQPPLHLQSQGCLQLRCTLDLEFNMSTHTHVKFLCSGTHWFVTGSKLMLSTLLSSAQALIPGQEFICTLVIQLDFLTSTFSSGFSCNFF